MEWKRLISYACLFAVCFIGGRAAGAYQETYQETYHVSSTSVQEGKNAQIAIVIDDFGYDGEGTAEMLSLPIPLTAAVLPFCEHTAEDLEKIEAAGKEVFLHMPMEALTGKREWVGENGIFCSMSEDEIRCAMELALEKVPQAVGVNNHMGSAVMEDEDALRSVMVVVAERELLFLDSKTTANSFARALAEESGVTFLDRDVFLDSTDSVEVVKQRLQEAMEIALQEGKAIAIGHVGPEGGKITAEAIAQMIPEFEAKGITFVTMREIARENE